MKLIPNLGNKTNYVLHYRNLQLYLFLGIRLTIECYNLGNLIGQKNISILTLKKEQIMLIVLKNISLNR